MTAARTDPDSDAWDSKRAYHYVRSMIVGHQGHEHPTDAPVAERQQIRRYCCDTGALGVDRFETALRALDERNEIALGDRYVGHYDSRTLATAAIEWVVAQESVDRRFIGAVNALEVQK